MTDSGTAAPALAFEDVSFSYPVANAAGIAGGRSAAGSPSGEKGADLVLRHVSLEVPEGAFALLTGATGSGKSTLLRLAKPEVAPAGKLAGTIRAFGRDVRELGPVESAEAVGYVFQSPDAQIVCDTVWHEMAFGLENLGVPEAQMRRRVAETCTFFGMEPWFRRKTAELSGGQRQVLALAATLAMRPRLLLLDEPTSMLDPVAEKSFLSLLFRANRELGITVVVATHNPAAMVDYATCAFRLEDGGVAPRELTSLSRGNRINNETWTKKGVSPIGSLCVEDGWFRYGRDEGWVLRGLDLKVGDGEVRALVGGNGSGKSTLLHVVAGVQKLQRGRVRNACAADQALLPQNPKALLSAQTVGAELRDWMRGGRYDEKDVARTLDELGLSGCEERHPYDLSGGQQQLLALAKLLLVRPRLLLLDEPTKGLDDACREKATRMVRAACDRGATVLLATHDLDFVAEVADSVSLLFDGQITVTEPTDEYFAHSWL